MRPLRFAVACLGAWAWLAAVAEAQGFAKDPTPGPAPQPATPAPAAATPAGPQVATTHARLYPILPTLRLTGTTAGAGEIAVALSIRTSLSDHWNIDIAPRVSIASAGGIASLFSFSDGLTVPKTWLAGLTVTLAGRPDDPDRAARVDDTAGRLQAAYELCRAACGTDGGEKAFCDAYGATPAVPRSMDPSELCAAGRGALAQPLAPVPPVYAAFPRYFISAGGAASGATYPYYNYDAITGLQPRSDTEVGGTGAISFAWVRQLLGGHGLTAEAAVLFDRAWTPSTQRVRWCHVEGTNMGDPVESCNEGVLGAPTAENRVFAAAEVGFVDIRTDARDMNRARSLWRGAAGPFLDYRWTASSSIVRVGAQLPVYLHLSEAIGFKSDNYKGLVRVTPVLAAERTSAGWGPSIFVVVDLLGERYMFNRALDWR